MAPVILKSQLKSSPFIQIKQQVFIDTVWEGSVPPDSIRSFYYNLRGKYPESSETILFKASEYLRNKHQKFTGSGYITFRFVIDSLGNMMKRVQLLQVDEQYKDYSFSDDLVLDLFQFLKTLNAWKPAPSFPKFPNFPPYYNNIMSFKIHEGEITDIIP